MDLLYQAKRIWGILSHPEYADPDGGFVGFMKKDALTYDIQGKTFVDEAYVGKL